MRVYLQVVQHLTRLDASVLLDCLGAPVHETHSCNQVLHLTLLLIAKQLIVCLCVPLWTNMVCDRVKAECNIQYLCTYLAGKHVNYQVMLVLFNRHHS